MEKRRAASIVHGRRAPRKRRENVETYNVRLRFAQSGDDVAEVLEARFDVFAYSSGWLHIASEGFLTILEVITFGLNAADADVAAEDAVFAEVA
jgi:hypothetical protein